MSFENEIKCFKKIDDITEYVKKGLKSGTLTVDEVAKFARIKARQGVVGEEIITIMDNGLKETKNIVKIDEKTGNPGWVVTNPNGEQYIIEDSIFQNKYEIDKDNPIQYKPKGNPVLATQIDEHIEFTAPWGEIMKIEAGGSLILNSQKDIYGIQKKEFENTYSSTGKTKEECLKQVLDLFEISKEELSKEKEDKKENSNVSKTKTNSEEHIMDL